MSKKKYRELAEKFLPTIKDVCSVQRVPSQVCFAQLVVESGGESELAKVHNYFGLKFRKRLSDKLFAMGVYHSQHVKLTKERITLRDMAHYEKLKKRGAIFLEEVDANPAAFFGKRITIKLPLPFFAFKSMRDGIVGYCLFVKRSRYMDAIMLCRDPVRWIGYVWARGYATADHYPEAVVKRMQRVYTHLGDESFNVWIDEDLAELLEELRKLEGPDRWDLAQSALDHTSFKSLPFEELEFTDEEAAL